MLLFIDALVALDEGEVRLRSDVGRAPISLEILDALLSYSILERTHALHHFLFYLWRAVDVIRGEKVLGDWGGGEKTNL